jgi:hypothetical protein
MVCIDLSACVGMGLESIIEVGLTYSISCFPREWGDMSDGCQT